MRYTIHTKGHAPQSNGEYHQFERYVGRFQSVEDAKRGARFLSNGRNLPLSYYRIVNADDVSDVIAETIEPAKPHTSTARTWASAIIAPLWLRWSY
jgi:hypothetical protein